MEKRRKLITSVVLMGLIAVLTFATLMFSGCGSAEKPRVYTTQSCYIEEAYRGDCWNGVSNTLILNADGTYTLIENTSIIQYSGVVVTYWTYTMEGTYEVSASTEESETVVLSAATSVEYNMNGTVTTSADNESLLQYTLATGGTYECDILSGKYSA